VATNGSDIAEMAIRYGQSIRVKKMRRIRFNIRKFIREPSFQNFMAIRYHCDSGRIETAPCFMAESKTWRASCGGAHGCDACPLSKLNTNYISPFTPGSGNSCAMVYFTMDVQKMLDYWNEHQGEVLLAFTLFELGLNKERG
jgi:hypothetical protein